MASSHVPGRSQSCPGADPHVGRASTLLEADTRPTPEIMRDTTDETRSLLAQWPVLVRELKVDTHTPGHHGPPLFSRAPTIKLKMEGGDF